MGLISRICLGESALVREAIERMNRSGRQIILVVDEQRRLIGTFTDGDLRRALIGGASLESPLAEHYNRSPHSAPAARGRAGAVEKMREVGVDQMPVVDEQGRVVRIESINPARYGIKIDNRVIIMAGGMGKRLHPVTRSVPKALVPIGERPILEVIIERLIGQGFQHFTLVINHLGEMIEDYFGDGSRWNVTIGYLRETQRMGTVGGLSLLPERPTMPFLVLNCDVLTTTNFQEMVDFSLQQDGAACIGVRESSYQMPFGVVRMDASRLVDIVEKPEHRFYLNTGIYCLAPEALDYLPHGEFFDMPDLIRALLDAGRVVSCYPVSQYWIDIGQPEELARARSEFHLHF